MEKDIIEILNKLLSSVTIKYNEKLINLKGMLTKSIKSMNNSTQTIILKDDIGAQTEIVYVGCGCNKKNSFSSSESNNESNNTESNNTNIDKLNIPSNTLFNDTDKCVCCMPNININLNQKQSDIAITNSCSCSSGDECKCKTKTIKEEEKELFYEIHKPVSYFIIYSKIGKSKILLINAGAKGLNGYGGGAGL